MGKFGIRKTPLAKKRKKIVIGRNTTLEAIEECREREEKKRLVQERLDEVSQLLKRRIKPTWSAYRKFLRIELSMVEQKLRERE
jgi:DNA-binding transcriptional regulator GbsR (MarR family)